MSRLIICIVAILFLSAFAAQTRSSTKRMNRLKNVILDTDAAGTTPDDIAQLLSDEPISARVPAGKLDGLDSLEDLGMGDCSDDCGDDIIDGEVGEAEDDSDISPGLQADLSETEDDPWALPPGTPEEVKKAVVQLKQELQEIEVAINELSQTIKEEQMIVQKLGGHDSELKKLEAKKADIEFQIQKKVLEAFLDKHLSDLDTLTEMKERLLEKGSELGDDEGLIKSKISSVQTQLKQLDAIKGGPAGGAAIGDTDVLGGMDEQIKNHDAISAETHIAAKSDVSDFLKGLEAGMAAPADAAAAPGAPAADAAVAPAADPAAAPADAAAAPADAAASPPPAAF